MIPYIWISIYNLHDRLHMDQPKRLFDCLQLQMKTGPVDDLLAAKEGGAWKKYSTGDVIELVNQLSAGLLNLGISCGDMSAEGRDKIAILSKNRPEWIMVDLAVQQIGAILTPLYPTINVKELEFVLNDAEVKMVFVNDEELYHKVLSLQGKIPSLKHIFTFEKVAQAAHWKDVIRNSNAEALQKVPEISARIGYEDLATIIYTSGTTGTPKGVMLSHENIVSNVVSSIDCVFNEIGVKGQRALSFLPLNHILERMVTYIYLFSGTSVYYADSFDTIGENLKEVQPTLFTTVPRLLEKVYERIMQKGMELTGIKRKLFYWAHGLAENFEINKNQGLWYTTQLALANKLVFSKWREGLGGNVKAIVSGGAACQVKLIRIFTAAKITIMEGYGLTETSPVISVNRFNEKGRKFGTVGPLIDGVEVRIAEDGEILCKGKNVMVGYYKRPDLTAEVMNDGWFATGDIGLFEDNIFLKITDRKKEMFKTSGGKYVAPLPIESKLKESLFVEQLMVIGSERKFVGALIVPSFANLKDWCRQKGIIYTTNEEMIRHPKVVELFKDLVESFNIFFNHVEQIKRFELLPNDWSIDTGELTPKLSLKRKVIMEKYQEAIDRIYSEK
ncbi:AMP-dependent synthetase/ligase [Flavihumibacter profundi]|uniref:AMP-dependent synthetase/ligase n=1 Tax=Flavihumibacter profundi TaxID=2716883 RepID=UPI001CC442B9|nr:long-chain fatty acid--CoA ligase [Flavihumibacter profundi]MBZ5858679.1 long-chain fatty acid--CoA ligase [Flavihumibacter profundi]